MNKLDRIKELVVLLNKAGKSYYSEGREIMSNYEYDKLYDELVQKKAEGKEFNFYHFKVDLNGGPCVYKRISGCGAGFEYVAITPQGEVYP